ncbi:MAG TPA: potassium-transporting ATPase subunit F [Burkholderiaceae bacterium]|jgi:hypothetical protein|nr:potassium-transporting ATPase subunit F [Burkholderiaceae bacterium]
MTWINLAAALAAGGLLVYLIVGLLRAEEL